MSTWLVVLVVAWLVCWPLCWRMGRETGYNGVAFGVAGPLGVVLLALLPSRKTPSEAVARLEEQGPIGLRTRRRNLGMRSSQRVGVLGPGWRQQIREDVAQGDRSVEDS